ncbi:(2Fe-2S)-binding protein [Parasphingorhabdus sp. DH2-15]|jgi:bacterioferritin-associated ferredoxin|uniref:(2Fe-2S)-binding protein n=1 Tax=Parasphingorhabdus sp. DH2-15 TaxID=3444112 RepID=UPI003F686322
MVVCVCNAIKEKDLRAAFQQCPSQRPHDVYAKLGRKPKCGQCLQFAQSIINAEAASA